MGLSHSPSIVTDGLIFCLDAGNRRSYPGSGTDWKDLTSGLNQTLVNMDNTNFDESNVGALNFDGTNEYVQAHYLSGSFASITFELWSFYDDQFLNPYSRDESLFGDWNSNRVHFAARWSGSSAGMHFNVNGSWSNIPYTNLVYGWNHYVAIWDYPSNSKKVYVNGKLAQDTSVSGSTLTIGINEFRIGVATNLGYYHRGKISDFKVYNRMLSDKEVFQNYLATKSRYI